MLVLTNLELPNPKNFYSHFVFSRVLGVLAVFFFWRLLNCFQSFASVCGCLRRKVVQQRRSNFQQWLEAPEGKVCEKGFLLAKRNSNFDKRLVLPKKMQGPTCESDFFITQRKL